MNGLNGGEANRAYVSTADEFSATKDAESYLQN